ncbi:envelope stress response membrane protein PspC [Motiliproteus sp. MSK22-1]|uniref:envelope stress response membrane protein PspC n=1 Tax=Motiliproteus sp. MSK22-1 TaxID=1897630 RepID=UPI00097878A1|nr:envelope stress response membrane protein PspC [Motiliproteus sp. MSK22-1]OMH25877.1 hypothetical protein BGP75_25535 [Motiliproteus sp. MSK22-1]
MSQRKPGKANGYNMNLYRRPDDGWFFGVCAGLANHFEVPEWMARLVAVTLFLFTGELAILLYVAAIFLLAKHPRQSRVNRGRARRRRKANGAGKASRDQFDDNDEDFVDEGYESSGHHEHLFSYGPAPSSRLKEMKARLSALDQRLRSMETYVTSKKYRFNQEINDL